MMTIAITAVSGHLGQAIARTLIDMPGIGPVVGLARTPAKASGLGIEVRPGDYTRPDQLKTSLAGVDTLLLVSGMDAPDARIQQHRNVIEAAKAAGVSKIVYTSIQGPETGTTFSPVVQSNRQTEADIRASGLAWAIGRNGIYIEPDIEYIDSYKARGEIANSAGDGKCGYTTRAELGHAYASLLTGAHLDGQTVNLHGEAITQTRLAALMNTAFGTQLVYRALTPAEYLADRTAELGEFLGSIIAGIYDGIRLGAYDNPSDFEAVTGRPHQDWAAYFRSLSS
ncbi:SDR family oxidoreductase [Maricaulis sp.]|uniref:SDR family oxidoreductase n=1 Tax=Maricaulis sp. TaxID=1486257 RepID=UPI003A903F52